MKQPLLNAKDNGIGGGGTMETTAITNLNARIGSPSVNAPCYSFLKPGDHIEYKSVVRGDPYEGNDLWLKGPDGNYYWSGGTSASTVSLLQQFDGAVHAPDSLLDYNALFKIPENWRLSLGRNVTIALIDTGIFAGHPDFLNRDDKIVSIDCADVPTGNPYDVDDAPDGHGTHCAGLIGANSHRTAGVGGLAPLAHLMMVKGYHNVFHYEETRVANSLKYAIDQGAEIISMSFNVNYPDNDDLNKQIQRAIDSNVLLVGAAGDDEDLIDKTLYYPAMFDNCVKVGAITDGCLKSNRSSLNKKIDFILKRVDIVSTSTKENGYYLGLNGSSMATAIVSGIAALCLSALKGNEQSRSVPVETIIDSLYTSAELAPERKSMDPYGMYTINPKKRR
jgi:subtilisin family serine protease